MRLLIFGPQGAGKGTQGRRVAEEFDLDAIATGDMFRWAISKKTDMGMKAREYVDEGRLVPDDVTVEVVRERLEAKNFDDFLLDGFPRNTSQADSLDKMLSERSAAIEAFLVLEVPEEVSLRRIVGRRVCSNCGRNYHEDAPPEENWTCDRCGGQVKRRTDDTPENVKKRLRLYHEQTEPLKSHYRDVLRVIDGIGTPDEVFSRILESLK
jgi:adenylate kinase